MVSAGGASSATSKKTICGGCGATLRTFYDRRKRQVRDLSAGGRRVYLEFELRRVDCPACGAVKQERLDFLSSNSKFTKRLALVIGDLCRTMSTKDVAKRMQMDWHTVKELDKDYMREQVKKAGLPTPEVIGIDEISIGKRHVYRIVVSDLEKHRAIWFGGVDRSEQSLDRFFAFLGPKQALKIRLAVMDMWKAHRPDKSRASGKRTPPKSCAGSGRSTPWRRRARGGRS